MALTNWKNILGKLTERIKPGRIGQAPAFLLSFPGKLRAFFSEKIFAFLKLFPGKKKIMLFTLGGFALLFLVLIICVLALRSPGPEKAAASTAGPVIPMEELFIPDEPDFIPDFLPEREARSFWSVDDIRPYWKDPAGPEFWREEIKSAVDELMESVP